MIKLGPKCALIILFFPYHFAFAQTAKAPVNSREELIRKYGGAEAIKQLEHPTPAPTASPKPLADGDTLEQKLKAMLGMGKDKAPGKEGKSSQDAMMDNMLKNMLEKYKTEPGIDDESFAAPPPQTGPVPAAEVKRPSIMIAPGRNGSEKETEKPKANSLLEKILADMKLAGNSIEKIQSAGPTEKLIRMSLMSYQIGNGGNLPEADKDKKAQKELLERTEGRSVQKWFVNYPILLRIMAKGVLHPDALANFGKIVDQRDKLIIFGLINIFLFILGFVIKKIYFRNLPLWKSIRVGLMMALGLLIIRLSVFWAFYHQEVGPFFKIVRQSL